MQLINKSTLPNAVVSWLNPLLAQFSVFQSNARVVVEDCHVASIGGDTSYTILHCEGTTYVLVTTDHPDPLLERRGFEALSKKYSFAHIVTPGNRIVNLSEDETYNNIDDFFLRIGTAYYYCVQVTPLS